MEFFVTSVNEERRLEYELPKTPETVYTSTDFQLINSLQKHLNAKLKYPFKKAKDFSQKHFT